MPGAREPALIARADYVVAQLQILVVIARRDFRVNGGYVLGPSHRRYMTMEKGQGLGNEADEADRQNQLSL